MDRKVFATIGEGGREFALRRKLQEGEGVSKSLILPGNAGIPSKERLHESLDQFDSVIARLRREGVTDVHIGSEKHLDLGWTDRFRECNFRVFGPTQVQTQLESSKVFSKKFMARNRIKTAKFRVVVNMEQAIAAIDHFGGTPVVKADGLAGGKGVTVPESRDEAIEAARDIFERSKFKSAGSAAVIEQQLQGEERSSHWFCDGVTGIPLIFARDYKRAFDGDKGPNTGGMGALARIPGIDEERFLDQVRREVIEPLLRAIPFQGVLYVGLMETEDGLFVLEFNVRFGDPETQVLLALLKSDPSRYFTAGAEFNGFAKAGLGPLEFSSESAVYVVRAAEGYPERPELGYSIQDNGHDTDDAYVCYSGVKETDDPTRGMVSASGRVFGTIGIGPSLATARARSYGRQRQIYLPHSFMRSDIALIA